MTLALKFEIGAVVYHRLKPEEAGLVTAIYITPGCVSFYVTWKDRTETRHYEIELTDEKGYTLPG